MDSSSESNDGPQPARRATISLKGTIKAVSFGAFITGSVYFLYRYKNDPKTVIDLVEKAILPSYTIMVSGIVPGCFNILVGVESLEALDLIWERYLNGELNRDLEDVILPIVNNVFTEELKEEFQSEGPLHVSIVISEEDYQQASRVLGRTRQEVDIEVRPKFLPSDREKTNLVLLSRLLTECGRQVFQDFFDSIHPPANLHEVLNSEAVKSMLHSLRTRGQIYKEQMDTLYPTSGIAESKNFEITLLFHLLKNICDLKLPTSTESWDKDPLPTDLSQVADLIRIKKCRNELFAHRIQMALTDEEFDENWNYVEAALNRLSASKYKDQIEHLKKASVDYEKDFSFYALLQSWEEGGSFFQKQDEMEKEEMGSEKVHFDEQDYATKLQEVIIKRSSQQLMGRINIQQVKADEIFPNLVAYHENRIDPPRKKEDDKHAAKTVTEMKKFSDIFYGEEEKENPKRILITGDRGIGKTMFSKKLLVDIAKNDTFIPGVKFMYLLPLESFNNVEKLNLQELLKRCPWLDKATIVDEAVIDHIVENQEKLLIVFDGFDKFDHRKDIVDQGFESKFSNDPTERMPVAALVAKILGKKMLEHCRVILTTRPSEVDELKNHTIFDEMVKINRFSKNHFLDYVTKYFNSYPEEIKDKALERAKSMSHYESLGSMPLCFLMCQVIESEIKNQRENSAPIITLTQFYKHIIYSIERYHNDQVVNLNEEAASLAVSSVLNNLAKLATWLVQENSSSCTTVDLEKLGLNENESLQIISSNLLCCSFVQNNSPSETDAICEYRFVHYSIQEFFVAWHLAKMGDPTAVQKTTEMVKIFTSGLLGLHTNTAKSDELMCSLLADISKQDRERRLVMLRCLYEYGQDKELTRNEILSNKDETYWSSNGEISLSTINDTDCSLVNMILSAVESKSKPDALSIINSVLTCSGLNIFLPKVKDSKITNLKLENCQLDKDGVRYLAWELPPQLTKLNLSGTNISDDGVRYLAMKLPPQLTNLNLSGNNISGDGVHYLAQELPRQLTELNLSDNNISGDEVHYLARELPRQLTELNLSGNNISDGGVHYLAMKLPPQLTKLNLSGNNISDRGVRYLAMKLPPQITELNLSGNNISVDGVQDWKKKNMQILFDEKAHVII